MPQKKWCWNLIEINTIDDKFAYTLFVLMGAAHVNPAN